jgi:hypothetical protein
MGVDVGPSTLHPAPNGAGPTYTYGPFSSGPQVGPPGLWTGFQVNVSFILSGNNDQASLTGDAIAEVPRMGPGLLGALAIAGLTLIGRRTSS